MENPSTRSASSASPNTNRMRLFVISAGVVTSSTPTASGNSSTGNSLIVRSAVLRSSPVFRREEKRDVDDEEDSRFNHKSKRREDAPNQKLNPVEKEIQGRSSVAWKKREAPMRKKTVARKMVDGHDEVARLVDGRWSRLRF
ncbi:hypothetical protein Ccrd_016599 [Cynara cardunculus var. scolymus]|uniref:Uncharacterized protein n=1 Tax=Cynara cardunculus var. scolymus TaxID=59895 RepID=A0A118K2Y1_CYNCS|nr:hypothetical protein Ccrd_016599 [Cynara cardunculus var. scolymus]